MIEIIDSMIASITEAFRANGDANIIPVGDGLLWSELDSVDLRISRVDAADLVKELKSDLPSLDLLDYGCGSRNYREVFEGIGLTWRGLDVEGSRDPKSVKVSKLTSDAVTYYDGSTIPFADESFGSVFSNQVFEHVPHIDDSLKEIARILKVGGYLFGSVSQTEPYHSLSTFNWTPYGLKIALERNGFTLLSLSAGVDGFTLGARYLANAFGAWNSLKQFDQAIFEEQRRPLWDAISAMCKDTGKTEREAAIICLGLAGHIQFVAVRQQKDFSTTAISSDMEGLFPTQHVPEAPVIPIDDLAIGAPYAPFPRSWRARTDRLGICEPLASPQEIAEIIRLRSEFRVGNYPDPYVNDIARAFRLLKGKRNYLEIGTFDRGNLAYVSSLLHEDAHLIGLDVQDEPVRDALLRTKIKSTQSYTPIVGSSRSPASIAAVQHALQGEKLDAVFIDGDHTAYGTMCDYANFEDIVADDGVILFHDSAWEGDAVYKGVADALDEINRTDAVYLIDGENPCRLFTRPLWRQQFWGVVGVVFANEQHWRVSAPHSSYDGASNAS